MRCDVVDVELGERTGGGGCVEWSQYEHAWGSLEGRNATSVLVVLPLRAPAAMKQRKRLHYRVPYNLSHSTQHNTALAVVQL